MQTYCHLDVHKLVAQSEDRGLFQFDAQDRLAGLSSNQSSTLSLVLTVCALNTRTNQCLRRSVSDLSSNLHFAPSLSVRSTGSYFLQKKGCTASADKNSAKALAHSLYCFEHSTDNRAKFA